MGKKNRTAQRASPNKQSPPTPMVEIPAMFMRELIRQLTFNPQKTSGQKSYNYSLYTKENILTWLQSPATSEKSLRDASNYMYLSSMHYQRLINYYAGILTGAYVVSPLNFSGGEQKADTIKKQYYKIANFLELLDIPSLLREVLTVALREGAYYGIVRKDKSSAFIQKIDADYCKISSICNGTFLYCVDMSKIGSRLEYYPLEFTTMYNAYLQSGQKYQEVPMDISVCVKADSTIVDFTVPPFAAVMPSLYTIANTENLQETSEELKNYKVLTGKVPVNSEGTPIMEWDLFVKYYNHLANSLGEHVGLAITPFDMSAFNFEQKSGTGDVDEIARAVSNFWATAGTSGLLHGMENDTAGVTKLSIKNDETYVYGIAKQFERVINRFLKTNFSGTVRFKITLLPVTVFNREDYVQEYKESASFGLGKSYYAATLGIPQQDVAGLDFLEKDILAFNELEPFKSSYTESKDETGRPEKAEEDLTESGTTTRANDTNENR